MSNEDEEPEQPQPSPRVIPTPEWLVMQDAKQKGYEQQRARRRQRLEKPDE